MAAMPGITVTLPDGSPLELDDGASGADAAAAIGPGLAKAALAIRVAGETRDLAAPLADGESIEIVTAKSDGALDLIRHDAAHVMAEAVCELYPGTRVSIGPPIEVGFYYDFEFPEGADVTDADLERIEAKMAEHIAADESFERTDIPVAEALDRFQGRGPALQGRADRGSDRRRGRRDRLAVPERTVHRPLSRPARPVDRPDRGDQAQLARRCVLARRRDPADADPHLRDCVLLEEGPRRTPRADRAGEGPRSPQARPAARSLHVPRGVAGDAVLVAAGNGAAEADPRSGRRPARQARLRRDPHPGGDGRRPLAPLRPLRELPREHVLRRALRQGSRGGRPAVRAEADELPGRLPRLRLRPPLLSRPAAAPRRVRQRLPLRARGRAPRPAARPRLHPGRRSRLLHARPDRARGDRRLRGDRRALRDVRLRGRHASSSRPGRRSRSAPTSSGRSPRRRSPRRSTSRTANTRSTPATAPSTARRSTST